MQRKIFNPWKTLLEEGYNFSFRRKRVPLGHHYIKRLCMVFFFGWGWGGGRSLSPGYSFSLVLGFLLGRGVLVLTKKLKLWEHSSWTTYYGYLYSVVLSVHVKNHCICLVAFSMIIFRYTKLKGITILWTRLPLPYLSCSLIFLISILSFNLSITANLSYASAFQIEKWLPSQVCAPFRVSFPALHLAVFLVSF